MTGDEKSYDVSFDEDSDVARTVWLPGSVCGIEEARAVHTEIRALGRGKVRSLVDLREVDAIDRPAREFFMDQHADYLAVAMLVGSLSSRMLANFFLGLKRGPIPVRMFTSEPDAISWLREQP